jgi:endoglucanase
MFRRIILTLTGLVTLLVAAPQALAAKTAHDNPSSSGTISFSSSVYEVNESAGQSPITLTRTGDTSKPATFCYEVANKTAGAGDNFDKIGNTETTFAAGDATTSFNLTVHDQGINGPTQVALAKIFRCGSPSEPIGSIHKATINLLQNDPLAAKDPANPLGYPQVPTDGDPLQYVNWYIYGPQSPAGAAIGQYASSNPTWAQALHTIAYSPGSGTYRFWMWNQPAAGLASTVEKYLADAEVAQPNTTIALSSYSLVHGACESPEAIKSRYENWITQFAKGIGNFRVVLYLEEDSLIETHCLSHGAIMTRLAELAYAVKTLSADPHLLIYMDAGAPDASITPQEIARYLKKADIAQAQGFFVNATHNDWTTSDIAYGQQIARLTGGKHFIVQTDDNGRGPLVPQDRVENGNEDLCNPTGRGTGPLSWDTGYAYVDGFLWFNNPGNSDGPCGAGDPPIAQFWAQYAVGLVQHGTDQVTGPHFNLQKSKTNE